MDHADGAGAAAVWDLEWAGGLNDWTGRAALRHNGLWRVTLAEATIRLHLEPLEEGGYVATSPDVPGLVAEGRSLTEAVAISQDLARKIAESCLEHGDPMPPALTAVGDSPVVVDLLVRVGIA